MKKQRIFIIGSGNVATQLGLAFKNCGYAIAGIYSRNPAHARRLASKLKTISAGDLKNIAANNADIYLIAVKDDAIAEMAKRLSRTLAKTDDLKDRLVIHTSGATDISILTKNFPNCGVLWQAQTIQARTKADFKKIPLVIEANNPFAQKKLKQLAESLSNKVYLFNSTQRAILHLGAVWVNNFTNHLYFLAEQLLKKHRLPYELFEPLILSTALKGTGNPKEAQTGPAKRNDKKTMGRHLQLLHADKNLQKIYSLLSQSITRHFK